MPLERGTVHDEHALAVQVNEPRQVLALHENMLVGGGGRSEEDVAELGLLLRGVELRRFALWLRSTVSIDELWCTAGQDVRKPLRETEIDGEEALHERLTAPPGECKVLAIHGEAAALRHRRRAYWPNSLAAEVFCSDFYTIELRLSCTR